jgi:hypothetical protein
MEKFLIRHGLSEFAIFVTDFKNMYDVNNIVYSRNVIEFVAVANEFCQLIENSASYKTPQLIEITRKMLPLLYYKTSLLPQTESILNEELEKYVSELDYNLHQQKWLQKLGEHDLFHEVMDPELQFGTESVTASISEHLMDIYQDVKEFISSYNFGNEEVMNDALVECQSHFQEYWGQRLVNVLRAIHQLSFANIDWSEPDLSNYKPDDDDDTPSKWVNRFFSHDSE